jgi:hypothetical protein
MKRLIAWSISAVLLIGVGEVIYVHHKRVAEHAAALEKQKEAQQASCDEIFPEARAACKAECLQSSLGDNSSFWACRSNKEKQAGDVRDQNEQKRRVQLLLTNWGGASTDVVSATSTVYDGQIIYDARIRDELDHEMNIFCLGRLPNCRPLDKDSPYNSYILDNSLENQRKYTVDGKTVAANLVLTEQNNRHAVIIYAVEPTGIALPTCFAQWQVDSGDCDPRRK